MVTQESELEDDTASSTRSSWSRKQRSAFVAGLLGGTERKSVEPIALSYGVEWRQLQ